MHLSSIRDTVRWERRLATAQKRLVSIARRPCDSTPLFVLGKQRSGTSMLMRSFHRHPDMLVFDEHRNNDAFDDYRLRSIDSIRGLLEQARFPVVCMKPICDSHRIREIYATFPDGRYIWIYRDYRDVANSSLRKFGDPTRAIRLACTGEPGGGWFREGISPRTGEILQKVYRPAMSEFDLACLAWWARNQIIVESELIGRPNVTVLKYEALVAEPTLVLKWLFTRIGIEYRERTGRHMTPRSIGRHPAPEIDQAVRELCTETQAMLDRTFDAARPSNPSKAASF